MKNENIPEDIKSKSLKEAIAEIDTILAKLENRLQPWVTEWVSGGQKGSKRSFAPKNIKEINFPYILPACVDPCIPMKAGDSIKPLIAL